MRIRTIKPEFFTHEELHELEVETKLPIRLAFIGLWCAADREGRFKWEPRRLGIQILPYDKCDFSRVLDALMTRGFIVRYASNSATFGYIPTFLKHQVVNNREKLSELPEPSPEAECDACLTREGRVDHAGKAEGKGREGNKEGKGRSEAEEFQAEWNQSTFPKIATMSTGRTKSLNARFQEPFFLANWKDGITRASKSDFLTGKNDRGWKADPDWFLRPDTLPKILEGKYDNKTATQTVMIIE